MDSNAGGYYYSFSRYLREAFGRRVRRISLHAGFTCPNRDGSLGRGGCIYCDNRAFSPASSGPPKPIREQMERGMALYRRRGADAFLAYFQSYTNTYAPPGRLKALYDEALSFPDVVGLCIGTRPDCVPDDVLDLIADYAGRSEVWLELGLQSIHERTLRLINRGHDYECFPDAVKRAGERGIKVSAHVILGLPGEGRGEMLATTAEMARLKLDGIKLHNLHVIKGTPLEAMYERGEIKLLGMDEYLELILDVLELLPPRMVIQRLISSSPPDLLAAPRWSLDKAKFLRFVDEGFRARGTRQGSRYPGGEAESRC